MHLQIGTLLNRGKYRIIRYISSGGFGCTYEALNVEMDCNVAIKEFYMKDFCNRDSVSGHVTVATQSKVELVGRVRRKFVEEAQALYRMNHPNIVRVTDKFEENGTAYYVMDYVEGNSLAGMIADRGPLPEDEAVWYIRQTADALEYVHSLNRLHLDVKPHNIMIDNSGKVVLIDFGVSKQYDEVANENTSTLMGSTPGYAPPEQMSRSVGRFTPATDIYALGATLYKLLTGITPVDASLRSSGEELEPLPLAISATVRHAVEASMQMNKNKRPQSIGEFVRLVESGKMKTVGKREGENLFTHKASENSLDEVKDGSDGETELKGNVKGENGKLVADEFHSIDVVEVPDSVDAVISNESEESHSADAVIFRGKPSTARLSVSEESQPANNEILRSAQNDNSADGRHNDKDGKEKVERRKGKERSAGNVISNGSEKSQKMKSGKFLWIILLLLLVIGVYAWFVSGVVNKEDKIEYDTASYEYVDLGLPSGTKWATCNAGASTPSGVGYYLNMNEARECGWHLPTKQDFDELLDENNCRWEWTTENGINGYKVISKMNGNSIFLPAAAYRDGTSSGDPGVNGNYWSATPVEERPNDAVYYLLFDEDSRSSGLQCDGLSLGFSVRPVCK